MQVNEWGEVFYEQIKDDDLDILLANIIQFWDYKELGLVKILNLDPLTIAVYDCFECKDLPKLVNQFVHLIREFLESNFFT